MSRYKEIPQNDSESRPDEYSIQGKGINKSDELLKTGAKNKRDNLQTCTCNTRLWYLFLMSVFCIIFSGYLIFTVHSLSQSLKNIKSELSQVKKRVQYYDNILVRAPVAKDIGDVNIELYENYLDVLNITEGIKTQYVNDNIGQGSHLQHDKHIGDPTLSFPKEKDAGQSESNIKEYRIKRRTNKKNKKNLTKKERKTCKTVNKCLDSIKKSQEERTLNEIHHRKVCSIHHFADESKQTGSNFHHWIAEKNHHGHNTQSCLTYDEDNTDKIQIKVSGMYFIYSQITYFTTEARVSFGIMKETVNSKEEYISKCVSSIPHFNMERRSNSHFPCYTAKIVYLHEGEKVYIQDKTPNDTNITLLVDFEKHSTFWGLFLL